MRISSKFQMRAGGMSNWMRIQRTSFRNSADVFARTYGLVEMHDWYSYLKFSWHDWQLYSLRQLLLVVYAAAVMHSSFGSRASCRIGWLAGEGASSATPTFASALQRQGWCPTPRKFDKWSSVNAGGEQCSQVLSVLRISEAEVPQSGPKTHRQASQHPLLWTDISWRWWMRLFSGKAAFVCLAWV